MCTNSTKGVGLRHKPKWHNDKNKFKFKSHWELFNCYSNVQYDRSCMLCMWNFVKKQLCYINFSSGVGSSTYQHSVWVIFYHHYHLGCKIYYRALICTYQ